MLTVSSLSSTSTCPSTPPALPLQHQPVWRDWLSLCLMCYYQPCWMHANIYPDPTPRLSYGLSSLTLCAPALAAAVQCCMKGEGGGGGAPAAAGLDDLVALMCAAHTVWRGGGGDGGVSICMCLVLKALLSPPHKTSFRHHTGCRPQCTTVCCAGTSMHRCCESVSGSSSRGVYAPGSTDRLARLMNGCMLLFFCVCDRTCMLTEHVCSSV